MNLHGLGYLLANNTRPNSDIINSILGAGGLDYADFGFKRLDRQWIEPTAVTPANVNGDLIGLKVGSEKQGSKSFAQTMAAQTEGVANPLANGAVVGPIGSGGVAPAGWSIAVGVTGLPPAYIDSIGSDGSIGIRFAGVPSASGQVFIIPTNTPKPVAAMGELWLTSSIVSLAAGALPGAFSFQIQGLNVGVFVENSVRNVVLTGAPQNVQVAKAFAGATVNQASQAMAFNVTNGVPVDFTVMISQPSLKKIPAHYAQQATTNFKPALQSDGAKFDGGDDYQLSDWFAQLGDNCIIAKVAVPGVIGGTQVIAGASAADTTSRFNLGVNSAGQIIFGAGNDFPAAGPDQRGKNIICCLSFGALTQIFDDSGVLYSGARNGDPITNFAVAIGGRNVGGSVGGFFGGSIERLLFGKVAPTLDQFMQIRKQLLAQ